MIKNAVLAGYRARLLFEGKQRILHLILIWKLAAHVFQLADRALIAHALQRSFANDIHQPLHVSFEDDRGGNDVAVTGSLCSWNLHSVWDRCVIEQLPVPADPPTGEPAPGDATEPVETTEPTTTGG